MLKDLDFGAMGAVEITNGTVGVYPNGQHGKVSTGGRIGPFDLIDVDVATESVMGAFGGYYHAFETPLGGTTVTGAPRVFVVEPSAGPRWTRLATQADIDVSRRGFEIDKSVSWIDPLVGTRIGLELSERWNLTKRTPRLRALNEPRRDDPASPRGFAAAGLACAGRGDHPAVRVQCADDRHRLGAAILAFQDVSANADSSVRFGGAKRGLTKLKNIDLFQSHMVVKVDRVYQDYVPDILNPDVNIEARAADADWGILSL